MRSVATALALLMLAGAAPSRAADDAAARQERWSDLKHALFGDRAVVDDSTILTLEAPARALDAATVPLTVTLPRDARAMTGRIAAIWLVVDGNPSPLAGTFKFGPDADPRLLKTRVRVDQYSDIHAVAETEDGRLFATSRFVKAAGGCSAPSSKDPAVAQSRLGQMKLRVEGGEVPAPGSTVVANLLISHPNNNGMQVDQLSHNFIPARYIQDIKVTYGATKVLEVDADISLSEDPVITFALRLDGGGPLHVEMQDSARTRFDQSFDLARGS